MAKRSIPKASLDAAAMKRRAASIFVDREEPKAIYAAAIQELHERENVHFLSFYGVGGQGKSALYRELQRISSLPPYSEQDICVAALDLRLNKPIDNLQCWVMLRNAIAKVTGCRFPCFDFVYADYMKTAHDHVPPCLLGASRLIGFGGSNGDTANETASEGVQAGIEGAGKSLADSLPELLAESAGTVPVFGPLIKRGLKSAAVKGYEVWLKRNKIALEHLYPTTRVPTVDALKEALPRILAHELALHQGREKYLSQRLVIMVDEYENAMPGGGSENLDDSYKAGSWDSGLRDFITFCQGIEYRAADPEEEDALYSADVLLILFGREKINWARIERRWENLLCPGGTDRQHLLEGLSKKDADDFLVQAQVDEPDIRHAIIETAQAFDKTSGRHAVYPIMLDLAVQIYFDLKSKNLPVNPDEFSVSGNDYTEKRRDLLGRLLRNYDVPIREMLKRLACTREFDRELTAFLAEKHARAFNMSSFTVLTRLSFVSRIEDSDQWTLHQHISDTLLEGLEEIDRQETYKSLFDFYDGRSKAPSTSEVTLHHARALGLRYIYSALAQIPGDVRPKLDAAQEIAFGYPGAQEWLKQCFLEMRDILCITLPPEHPDIADSLLGLGNVFFYLRDFDAARTAYEEALEIRRAALPPEHPDIATSLDNLGLVFFDLRDFDAARAAHEDALEIRRAALPPELPDIASSLNNLGLVFSALRDFDAARAAHEEALEIRRAALPPEHPDIADSLNNLGNVFYHLRDFDVARTAYEEALEIKRAALPPEHPDIATSLNNLGLVFFDLRDFDAARAAHEDALEIRRAALPPEHPDIAMSLNNLGNVFYALRDFDAARTAYKEALEIRRAALPPEHPDIAMSLNNLGTVFYALRDFNAARTAYEEALEIKRAALPPEHPDIATSLNNLKIVKRAERVQIARDNAWAPQSTPQPMGDNKLYILPQTPEPWPLPILWPGAWEELGNDQAEPIIRALDEDYIQGEEQGGHRFCAAYNLQRLRWADLPFFNDGYKLIEGCTAIDKKAASFIGIWDGAKVHIGLGEADLIHTINRTNGINLASDAHRLAYLRFFCSWVRAEKGRFTWIESADCLTPFVGSATDRQALMTKTIALEIAPEPNANGAWEEAATIVYGSDLFRSTFLLKPDGMVDMLDYEVIPTPDGLIHAEKWEGPFRSAGYA